MEKILKKYPKIKTIHFKDNKFAEKFYNEFLEELNINKQITNIIFSYKQSAINKREYTEDTLISILPKIPKRISGIHFDGILTENGALAFAMAVIFLYYFSLFCLFHFLFYFLFFIFYFIFILFFFLFLFLFLFYFYFYFYFYFFFIFIFFLLKSFFF